MAKRTQKRRDRVGGAARKAAQGPEGTGRSLDDPVVISKALTPPAGWGQGCVLRTTQWRAIRNAGVMKNSH